MKISRLSLRATLIAAIAGLSVCWTSLSLAAELAPFTTDGCSSFPDGTPSNQTLWLNCCIRHDLSYWKGGTYQQRLDADVELEQCVAQAGEPDIAKVMLHGVRAGGSPFIPTPYRWGYGWPFGRGYQPLSTEELAQVAKRLEALQSILEEVKQALGVSSQAMQH